MKKLYLICAGLSFLAIIDLPYGYYTFLRIAITSVAIYGIIKEYKGEFDFWIISFAIVAILFNPLIPVHLGDKDMWRVLNLVCGILFLTKGLKTKNI